MIVTSNIRRTGQALAVLATALSAPASATTIVEMSKTLDFSGVVVNSSGQVAYFSEPLEGDDGEYDARAIHRDGGLWIAPGGAFVEIQGPLIITDSGVVMFGASQGEVTAVNRFTGESNLQEFGGVYQGSGPETPVFLGSELVGGDTVIARGNRSAGSPLGYSQGGNLLVDVISPAVRYPSPRDCGGRVDPSNPSDHRTPATGGVLRDEGIKAMDINDEYSVGFVDNRFVGTYLGLFRYGGCETAERFDDLKSNTTDVFAFVSDLKITEGNEIILRGRRNLAEGGTASGIYSIDLSGGVTIVSETSPLDDFRPQGVTDDGQYFFSRGGAVYFSDQPDRPVFAGGHQVGDFIVSDCAIGNNGYASSGVIACTGEVCSVNDEDDCYNAVILADGGTDFPPDPTDPPDDELVWTNGGGGNFDASNNWDGDAVPSGEQVAVFNDAGGYSVQFNDSSQQTRRLKVTAGDVDFETGSYAVIEDSGAEPSVSIAMGARLDIASGHGLDAIYVSIGASLIPGVGPGVLGVNGPSTALINQARLTIGDAGNGQLAIQGGGSVMSGSSRIGNQSSSSGIAILDGNPQSLSDINTWQTGNIAVGYLGQGELRILDGSEVSSQNAYIAYFGGSEGTAIARGVGSWDINGELIVGNQGPGDLVIDELGLVKTTQSVSVGLAQNSFGEIIVSDAAAGAGIPARSQLEVGTDLFVGGSGRGNLEIRRGAEVAAANLTIGLGDAGDGNVDVSGDAGLSPNVFSELTLSEGVVVGASGSGFLLIEDGATMRSESGVIGAEEGGSGLVTIRSGGGWDLDSSLRVGTASPGDDAATCDNDEISFGIGQLQLMGDGVVADITGQELIVTGPDSRITGSGRTQFTTTTLNNCAVLAPGNSPGTLTLGGDLNFEGGVLEVELSGLDAGDFDLLKVAGNADVSGGIVRFIFEGFLPQQGDQVMFLQAGGALNLADNMRFEYQGANDGFEFDVTADAEGNVTFSANNDAVDLLFGSGFENP